MLILVFVYSNFVNGDDGVLAVQNMMPAAHSWGIEICWIVSTQELCEDKESHSIGR
jgi:nitroreductase